MKILLNDKIPFFLAILFTALGYTLKSTYEEVVEKPIITYNFKNKITSDTNNFKLIFTNVSNNKGYRNLKFNFGDTEKDNILLKGRINSNPQIIGMNDANLFAKDSNPNTFPIEIIYFPPQSERILELNYIGKPIIPNLEIIPNDKTEFIILSTPTFQTFIASNNFVIKMILLICLIILVCFYFYLIFRFKTKIHE